MELTFFLNESSKAPKKEAVNLNEGEMMTEILAFQNSLLESEIDAQNILQEAILTEANEIATVKSNLPAVKAKEEGETKKSKLKDNVKKFFEKMVKWFKDIGVKIGNFIKKTVDGLIKRLKAIGDKIKALDKRDITVETKSPKFLNKSVITKTSNDLSKLGNDLVKGKNLEADEKLYDTLKKIETKDAKKVKMTSDNARGLLDACSAGASMTKEWMTKTLGLVTAKKTEMEKRLNNLPEGAELKDLRENTTKIQKGIRVFTKTGTQLVGMLYMAAGNINSALVAKPKAEETK